MTKSPKLTVNTKKSTVKSSVKVMCDCHPWCEEKSWHEGCKCFTKPSKERVALKCEKCDKSATIHYRRRGFIMCQKHGREAFKKAKKKYANILNPKTSTPTKQSKERVEMCEECELPMIFCNLTFEAALWEWNYYGGKDRKVMRKQAEEYREGIRQTLKLLKGEIMTNPKTSMELLDNMTIREWLDKVTVKDFKGYMKYIKEANDKKWRERIRESKIGLDNFGKYTPGKKTLSPEMVEVLKKTSVAMWNKALDSLLERKA